jgi:hypothetical protein
VKLQLDDFILPHAVTTTNHWKKFWKSIEGHRMEIIWTFIGNRMDFDYP